MLKCIDLNHKDKKSHYLKLILYLKATHYLLVKDRKLEINLGTIIKVRKGLKLNQMLKQVQEVIKQDGHGRVKMRIETKSESQYGMTE